ncbi:hypothetical protein ACUN0C_04385 [Faunimonas sp. B44]|uniref:hypothetical protein n=1 Tax=Faunimonas sp. B44 TaxID=3461493 RepID=UPI004044A0D7
MKLKHYVRAVRWRVEAALTSEKAADEALERVTREKALVFCVTAGRSGSDTLARLLARIPEVDARHEPRPDFVLAMRPAQKQPELATEFLRKLKIPAIAASPKPVYAETSHLFGKGFVEPLLGLGLRPGLIMLKRDPRQIALSYLRLETVPARTSKGRRYLLDPDDRVFLGLDRWRDLTDYQLLYWYALETEERQKAYAARAAAAGCWTVFMDVEELNAPNALPRLAEALGIERGAGAEADAIGSGRHNRKAAKAHRPLPEPDRLAELEDAVAKRLFRTG